MAPNSRQLRLLLWKDYLIRKRKLITLFGVIWAIAVVGSLWIVRINVDNVYNPTCQYPARALPSAGMLTFLQSFICSINNECSSPDMYQEIPDYENSRFTQLRRQFGPLLYNETVIDVASTVPDALKLISTIARVVDDPEFIDIVKNGIKVKDLFTNQQKVKKLLSKRLTLNEDIISNLMDAEINLQGILSGNINRCDSHSLSTILIVDNVDDLVELVDKLCPLTNSEIQKIFFELLPYIDISKYIKLIGDMVVRLNGDTRVRAIGDTVTAVVRMSNINSFIPPEIRPIFAMGMAENQEFSYFNLTIISKLMDLFEPIFSETDSYKSLREISDAVVSGLQWLHRIFGKSNNQTAMEHVTDFVISSISNMKSDWNNRLTNVDKQIQNAVQMIEDNLKSEDAVGEIFGMLSKITTFLVKWVPKRYQHDILLYSTLLAQLVESANRVTIDNIRMEEIIYNVSLKNAEALQKFTKLSPLVVGNVFDALTDANRIQLLTSKINNPGSLFCDIKKLGTFLSISEDKANDVKQHLCTNDWKSYITDLFKSFGVYQVKDNINTMASLLIQETLGKDTSSQLYSIEKDFEILEKFTKDLINVNSEPKVKINWNNALNVSKDSELMKTIRKKQHLGKQILVTAHGAFARQVVKQNTILEIKLTPILIDATDILQGLNDELNSVPRELVHNFKKNYPTILKTVLLTSLDEEKTLKSLSTNAVEIFCRGPDNATTYVNFENDVDVNNLVEVLCATSTQIEKTLSANSTIAKAIKKVMIGKKDAMADVNWNKLINNLKNLYKNIEEDYPYMLEFTAYGVAEDDKNVVKQLLKEAEEFWFNKKNIPRTIHLSMKFCFQFLDLLDRDIFNLSFNEWYIVKHIVDSSNSILRISDQLIKLITDLNTKEDDIQSDLPVSTLLAIKNIVPNIPNMIIDFTDIIMADDTDITDIIGLMNAEPSWPCSDISIAEYLNLTENSIIAVKSLETILCLNESFKQEWYDYIETQKFVITEVSKSNTTIYKPHIFLSFSNNFDRFVTDMTTFKNTVESIVNDATNNTIEGDRYGSAWRHVKNAYNEDIADTKLRSFFNKTDIVLNAVHTSQGFDFVPLNALWLSYLNCSWEENMEDKCEELTRASWKKLIKFSSVTFNAIIEDLLKYFTEINEVEVNIIQVLGFIKGTGVYILYEKLADFGGVLLNSYWDFGFMNQIRRASKSAFWDCEAVVDALVVPPGSAVTEDDIRKIKPYVCPSLLYWISLPRGENILLDIIAKPQYYFYNMQSGNLSSVFESLYNNTMKLIELSREIISKNITNTTEVQINTIETQFEEVIDKVLSWKLKTDDASYRLFNEVNKKQFISSIYLTRIVAITNKISTTINELKITDLLSENLTDNETSQLQSDLTSMQRIFKRRPSEAIAIHYDMLTELFWESDENFNVIKSLDIMCDYFRKNVSRNILNEGTRIQNQICNKQYKLIYNTVDIPYDDLINAQKALVTFVGSLQDDTTDVDINELLKSRKELLKYLKQSIKYSDDLSLPIYLKYLQSNLRHYDVILTFLAGEDWWTELKNVYSGPHATIFFEMLENSFEITENFLTHLDKIHLVRLIRDINVNSSDRFCMDNITISDYIPDLDGRLSNLKLEICNTDRTDLFKELPQLMIASQGYDNNLKLSREINYKTLEENIGSVENKFMLINGGPNEPMSPSWITEERLKKLKSAAMAIFSKDSLTKVSFGILSNIVDGSILFYKNSQCTQCSSFTSWFKQLNLQLYKKDEYDALLCRLHQMNTHEIFHTLKNDFHWDMAFRELISARNYTRLELNKSINEFLEQVKLHLLEDIKTNVTKVGECLAKNVTMNAFGNTALFISVVSKSLQLVRTAIPHMKEVEGIKEVQFFKDLSLQVTPKLHVYKKLVDIINNEVSKNISMFVQNEDLRNEILNGRVDLYMVKNNPNSSVDIWLLLSKTDWRDICKDVNCLKLGEFITIGLNKKWIDKEFNTLQLKEFWDFKFITNIMKHVEDFFLHSSRTFGVASRLDVLGAFEGNLTSILDILLQILQEDTMNSIIYSLQGIASELHPLLEDSPLEFDLMAVTHGLSAVGNLRDYLDRNGDLLLIVSKLFSSSERIESGLSNLGINNTNFWSVAAPRIHSGFIDLKPLLTSKQQEIHIKEFVCQSDSMSSVLIPDDIDVVTPEDVFDAVIEQFCGLPDERVKDLVPVLIDNLNFSYIIEKVSKIILSEAYAASNLTQEDGDTVVSKYGAILSLLPTVQNSVGNLTDVLAKEPLFESFKKFDTLNGLLSSAEFLSSAGKMICGKPFYGNDNKFYKAIAEAPDFSKHVDPEQLNALPTEFCKSLYKDVIGLGGGKIIWSFVKPLLMGKILYTPPSPIVNSIIEKANASFAQMSKLTNILHKFAASFSSVEQLSEHRSGVLALLDIIKSPALQNLHGVILPNGNNVDLPDVDLDSIFNDFGDLKHIRNLLKKASDFLRCLNLNRFHSAPDEYKLSNEAVKLTRVNEFSAGLVFNDMQDETDVPIKVEYKIRMDIDSVPTTTRKRNQFWTPGPEGSFLEDMRYFRGFVQIQDLIDKAIIDTAGKHSRVKRDVSKKEETNWAVYTQQIPYPCYMRDYFQSSLYESQAVVVAFFFSFIMTVTSAVRFIVSEKETGNTMLMSLMGVRLHNHTFSWFIASFVEMVVTVTGMMLMLRLGMVLPRSDPFLLWLLLLNYGFSIIMFCYLMSKVFTSASVGAVCAALALLLTFMPFVIILSLEADLSSLQKIITSISMSTSFCYSMMVVASLEAIGGGAQWSDVWKVPPGGDGLSLGVITLMVTVDAIIYLLVGCLIDRYFGINSVKSNITNCSSKSEKAGVSILNVSKVYGRSSNRKVALDNVSIELHRGQITTLLGQNGAGKTTLIKIITGMLKPSQGHVVVRSDNVHKDLTKLGVCPQQDVLFENLTTVEHLTLYAQLKSGLPLADIKDDIEKMLHVLSFGTLAHEQARRLSGGLRRRLCVALAFISRPQLVLLDEPSSGVDPRARRDIWSLIMKLKEDRTVLLTTHHLDEAELLSDQIVIMHKGQIHTVGSPIEIKRSLGNGYKLTVTYPENSPRSLQDMDQNQWDDEEDVLVTMEERTKQLLAIVRSVVKNAQLVDICGTEVEIMLPFFDTNGLNNNFLQLCDTLEKSQSDLCWSNIGLECSTLEQVLHNITQEHLDDSPPPEYSGPPSKSGSSSSIREDMSPLVDSHGQLKGTSFEQFTALLYKRWIHYTRNRWLLFLLVVLPSLFVAISMGFSLIRPPYDNEVALLLQPDLYRDATTFVVKPEGNDPELHEEFSNEVLQLLLDRYTPTTKWTPKDTPNCKCGDLKQQCDYTTYNSTPPAVLLLPNSSTLNDWLLATQEFYIENRYGGWSSSTKNNITNLIAWYNNKGHHAMPSFVNSLNTAILRARTGNPASTINTYTHPLKISKEQLSKSTVLQHIADVGIAGMLLLAFCLIPAGAAVYLVGERTSQQKRLQLLCGMTPNLYWASAITWDIMIIIINIILTSIVLLCFNLPVFVERENLPSICLLLLLFGFATNALTHVAEKLFRESSMANMILFCGNVFLGCSCLAILLILDIISESEATDNARWILHKIFLLSPQFALSDALVEIAKNTVQAQVLSRFGMDTYKSPLNSDLILIHITALVLVGAVLTAINLIIENQWLIKLQWSNRTKLDHHSELEDLEVSAERRRVESSVNKPVIPLRITTIGNINAGFVDTETKDKKKSRHIVSPQHDVAQCVSLSKSYHGFKGARHAVSNLTFGIPPGQCMALLGENGAGKSSTFGMLSGELRPTSGQIVLNQTVATQRDLNTGLVSYCPQNDAIDPLLTVTQSLQFYCRLRGITNENEVIKRTLATFDLTKYADVQNRALSGGNKRKLCTAIAFMGRSPLVLLDEPTSGMDPGSRSCVNRGVRGATMAGRAVLLSTHALPDARRLARTVALMRRGRLVALAPLQQSLHRFGGGYIISGRVSRGTARDAWLAVRRKAPHASLRALHQQTLQFLIPTVTTKLATSIAYKYQRLREGDFVCRWVPWGRHYGSWSIKATREEDDDDDYKIWQDLVDNKEIRTELSAIFRMMAELQSECDLEDFTLSQSSLDQMFLSYSDKEEDLVCDIEPLPTSHVAHSTLDMDSITTL